MIKNSDGIKNKSHFKPFSATFLVLAIVLVTLISGVSAQDSLGTFRQNDCVEIKQTCSSCSYVNLSISYPNSTRAVTNDAMSSSGGGTWIYDYCNTSKIGRYEVTGEGDIDGSPESFATYFTISVSGSEDIGAGEGLSLLGALLVILLVSGFFFVLSWRLNHPVAKISFVILASIILLSAVFYSMIMVQQNLGGFDSLVSGYSTFFTVLKILVGIAFISLMVFALIVAIRLYKFKRGFID